MPPNSPRVPNNKRLVIATSNPGKLREFRELLADLAVEVVAQGDLGLEPVEETAASFVDNALLKARHAARATGLAAIADDSGLEVDALGGAPGIFSARYAGPNADDAANNAKLMTALAGVPEALRSARYRCALVYVEATAVAQAEPSAPQSALPTPTPMPGGGSPTSPGAPIIAERVWEGRILSAPRGSSGFGYDPYFYVPELQLTAAELDTAEKNRRSHRGRALRELKRLLGALARHESGP